ncbi:cephalosporin esterase [Schizophyllum amplum]|uniref:Carboxylic ester hydrolase n=1 Tax=Schizophyllum amplum TaxID=97359 RepID=A0A550D0K1_9AGAR|nr:cephalosporin esterase [Auriculariopsis ampla]
MGLNNLLVIGALLSLTSSIALRWFSTDSSPIVDLDYAKYRGKYDCTTNTTDFLGIRYAAAPIGPARWRAPSAPKPESRTISATSQPPICLQGWGGGLHVIEPEISSSEDCLFLNIFAPGRFKGSVTEHAKLPILVYIHGGGYALGGAGYPFLDPRHIIAESGGRVLAVVIQYRLGVFGFLSGSDVQADGVSNAGLLDQRFALQWVHQHISKFGGDPDHVTVWGQSAGAGSVAHQLLAGDELAGKSLFNAAILSSLYLPPAYEFNDPIIESVYTGVLRNSGCAAHPRPLDCLRSMDASIKSAAEMDVSSKRLHGTFTFQPVVDNTFVIQRPSEVLAQRRMLTKRLYAITNELEGAIFVTPDVVAKTSMAEYIHGLFLNLTPVAIGKAVDMYAAVDSPLGKAAAIMGEAIFDCPTYMFMRAFEAPYKAKFAVPTAVHGSDMHYYFPGAFGAPPTYDNELFARAFVGSFIDFILNKDFDVPASSSITPAWAAWEAESQIEMLFSRTANYQPLVRPVKTDDALMERCRFWSSVASDAGQ